MVLTIIQQNQNCLTIIQWNLRIVDTIGTHPFVLCREVVLFQRLFCTECVLCWEVCPLSECPLSEVLLYIKIFLQNVQEDPITLTDPFYEKFQNCRILGKSPYYRPWFFGVLDDFWREPKFEKKNGLQEDKINTYSRGNPLATNT